MHFSGKILENGQVVLDRVAGEWNIDTSRRLFSWLGHFTVPPGQSFRPGTFELQMDDGYKGTLLVKQIGAGSGEATVVHFIGLGPLQ